MLNKIEQDIFDTTGSSGQTLISTPSGITWVNVEDIVSISTESYYSDISGISTISNRIDTTLTETDAVYYIPFVENPTSTSGEILRINGGLKYDPFTNNLGIGDTFFNSIVVDAPEAVNTNCLCVQRFAPADAKDVFKSLPPVLNIRIVPEPTSPGQPLTQSETS